MTSTNAQDLANHSHTTDIEVAKTEFFTIKVPSKPHLTASEGGHLFIETNNPSISDRTQLGGHEATELVWLTMVLGEALTQCLENRGIDVYRINYQDNGNWSFLRGEEPRLHIHLYGRSRNETYQTYGQALCFPDPNDAYYTHMEPFDGAFIAQLQDYLATLVAADKYAWHSPSSFSLVRQNEPPSAKSAADAKAAHRQEEVQEL